MINWILGGIIIALAALVIIRMVNKLRKGEDVCGCSGCDPKSCHCTKEAK